jgi:hypothetical protein
VDARQIHSIPLSAIPYDYTTADSC